MATSGQGEVGGVETAPGGAPAAAVASASEPTRLPLAYSPFPALAVPGNRVAVLRDGAETFPAMLEAIASARYYVHFEAYIFNDDVTGRRFAHELAAAAARGIEVALVYDSLGSWRSGRWLFDWMADRGVKVLGYKPLAPWRRGWGWLRRDHRKQLTVDGALGFTGGLNVGDQWAREIDGGQAWRDTMVRLVGPAVEALDNLFRQVWAREARRQRVDQRLEPRPRVRPPPAPRLPGEVDDALLWVMGNREFAKRRAIRRAYRYAIARARESVLISNPYFVPDHAILRSLRQARERGVRVALILPGRSDLRSVQWASRAVYDRLLSWGVELFHWRRPVFHAKTAVIDGAWSTVGSYNLDTQSLRYNLEVTAIILSRAVGARLERMFRDDLQHCEPISLAAWRRRPWWTRIPEHAMYALRGWL